MRLTKNQSIVLAVGLLGLFFLFVYLLVAKKQSESEFSEDNAEDAIAEIFKDAELADAKDPKFVLHNFHRSETENGRKVWEVKAKSGQLIPKRNAASVNDAKVWVYEEDGRVIEMDAKKALLTLDGSSLSQAELSGGIVVRTDGGISLKTESAIYDKEKEVVTSTDLVEIKSDVITVTGEGLEADINTQEFKLLKNVNSVITPQAKISKKKDEQK